MKKYVTGIVAIVIAMVIFSFTKNETRSTKQEKTGTYFWYEYDHVSDQLGALLNPNSSIKIAKEDVVTDCQDDPGQPDCVRGYDENNRAFEENPPAPLDQIKMTDESRK